MRPAADEANRQLVDQLIARGALWSRPVIAAFRATPRHRFLDRVFHFHRQHGWREITTHTPGRSELRLLYSDRALTTRLSEGSADRPAVPISSSSQPSLMAQMLEDLRLAPGQRTLEIGAGTGYNAALLAALTGRVISMDVDRRVLAEAREHLRAFPDRNVEFCHGDGRQGHLPEAPYDRLMVTAAAPDLEPAWIEQLAPEGVLLTPLELAPGLAYLVRGGVREGCFEGRLTRPAYFMPLRDEGATGGGDTSASSGLVPAPSALPTATPPWAEWGGERKPLPGGPGFLQALAFLGWLQGLAVSYQTLPDGRAAYGVCDLVHGYACWLGNRAWRVTGTAGADLGRRLWRLYLEAGGPWPTEFRLRAVPRGALLGEPDPNAILVFRRQGPRCDQVWELLDPRERPAWI